MEPLAPPTHVVSNIIMTRPGPDHPFPLFDRPMTDDEISEQYGKLIAEAHDAFALDPGYLLAMMTNASNVVRRRELGKITVEERAKKKQAKAAAREVA